jgi:hypothetical protein
MPLRKSCGHGHDYPCTREWAAVLDDVAKSTSRFVEVTRGLVSKGPTVRRKCE